MRRGDLVTVVSSGDYGKPRPALIVQADAYAEHPSLTVLPLTGLTHEIAQVAQPSLASLSWLRKRACAERK